MTIIFGVSNLLTREVAEWMDMGVASMPVIEMNRYAKSACIYIYTCIHQYMRAHVYFLESNCENGHAV